MPCIEVLADLRCSLERAGMRALETFDLRTARLGAADCVCPHHGTAQCDCEMVVLLVYSEGAPPVTLMLHGSDGETWISLLDDPARGVDPLLGAAIEKAVQSIRAGQGL